LTGQRASPTTSLDGMDIRMIPISRGNGVVAWVLCSSNGRNDDLMDADAEFIVTACNAHDDLMTALAFAAQALELAAELFDELTPSRTNPGMSRINALAARTALAKARGTS